MSDRPISIAGALNELWAALTMVGGKHMPRVVFDDLDDYMAVIGTFPPEMMPWPGKPVMLAGFRIEHTRKPVNEADRFVAQEIGA